LSSWPYGRTAKEAQPKEVKDDSRALLRSNEVPIKGKVCPRYANFVSVFFKAVVTFLLIHSK
jgi:hypothetical protein